MVRTGHHFNVAPTMHDDDRVIGLSDGALALWLLAGSYCVDHITDPGPTDGRVSVARAQRLRPSTWQKAASELVDAGLWKKLRGRNSGWQFVGWGDEQQTKNEREDYLRKESARKKNPPKPPNKNEKPRSDHERSARKPARNPAGTPDGEPDGTPPDIQAQRDKRQERDKELVDGHLGAQEQTRARAKPVDNSAAAEWRDDRCTDHQSASDADVAECHGCSRSRVAFERAAIREAAAARRAEAAAEAQRRVDAARGCSRCHGSGYVGSARCTHRPLGARQRAEAALRAEIGADAPGSDEEQPSDPASPLAGGPDAVEISSRVARHVAREHPTMPPINHFIQGAAR